MHCWKSSVTHIQCNFGGFYFGGIKTKPPIRQISTSAKYSCSIHVHVHVHHNNMCDISLQCAARDKGSGLYEQLLRHRSRRPNCLRLPHHQGEESDQVSTHTHLLTVMHAHTHTHTHTHTHKHTCTCTHAHAHTHTHTHKHTHHHHQETHTEHKYASQLRCCQSSFPISLLGIYPS